MKRAANINKSFLPLGTVFSNLRSGVDIEFRRKRYGVTREKVRVKPGHGRKVNLSTDEERKPAFQGEV